MIRTGFWGIYGTLMSNGGTSKRGAIRIGFLGIEQLALMNNLGTCLRCCIIRLSLTGSAQGRCVLGLKALAVLEGSIFCSKVFWKSSARIKKPISNCPGFAQSDFKNLADPDKESPLVEPV